MDFKIVIDDALLKLLAESELSPIDNLFLTSLVNDFEDGSWRFEKFQNFIWDNVAETALSHQEREALQSLPHSMLVAAAKNLRLTDADEDISRGSELAEIVLYGIMRHKYNALPVVPKIFYKQNANDTAKGADSVHIVLGADDKFTLWFGEAKFYNSIENTRLLSIVRSVKNALRTDKLKKENAIITNVSDIDHVEIKPEIKASIKAALSNKESIDSIKPIINIPILLLHECEITRDAEQLNSKYLEDVKNHHLDRAEAYFSKQIAEIATIFRYSSITFHLILFPVPDKNSIVDTFISKATGFRG